MNDKNDSIRLDVMLGWVGHRAAKSESPNQYMTHYSAQLARIDTIQLDRSPDYSDPIKLAAEIEALAALRRMRPETRTANGGRSRHRKEKEK